MDFSTGTLQGILDTWSYAAVALFVAVESSGIPFPGETMLVVAALYAGTGHLNIALVIASASLGAILGDNLGYTVGRTGGRAIVKRYGRYVRLDDKKMATAERFFDRHGDKTVFFGRFVAVLRAWSAFLAGLNQMHWAKFFIFNATGGICWAVLYGVLAFELGKNLPLLHTIESGLAIGGVAAAVVAAAVVYVVHRRRKARKVESGASAEDAASMPTGPIRQEETPR